MIPRQLLRHEAVQEGGADHEADEEAGALDGDGRKCDRDSIYGRQAARAEGCPDQVAAQRRREEQRVGREDPDGGHGVDWEDPVEGWGVRGNMEDEGRRRKLTGLTRGLGRGRR